MREEKNAADKFKQSYLEGIESFIAKLESGYEKKRGEYAKSIFSDPSKARKDLCKMLGYPLVGYKCSDLCTPEINVLGEINDRSVVRMTFEFLPGLKMTGLLFKKIDDQPRPMVIVQHGGLGTPELISGFYGSTTNYNDMLERITAHDVNTFAPQLLLWDQKAYPIKFDRCRLDARLKRLGSSITALEIFGIKRIIDYFEAQSYVKSFGMVGLSYGGFYTLFTAAIDTRILSAISCSYFNDRSMIPWSDWTWRDAAKRFGDAEIACLIYPRRLCIQVGTNDPLFDFSGAEREYARLKELTEKVGTAWLHFEPFEGGHEFCRSDEAIDRLIADISK